jgi:hypothetical protein
MTIRKVCWRIVPFLFLAVAACAEGPLSDPESADPGPIESVAQNSTICLGCNPSPGGKCQSCTCTPDNLSTPCRKNLEERCDSIYPIDCAPDGSCRCGPVAKPNGRTCWQACGVYDPARSCQCDSACASYGDCCYDKATYCSGCSCASTCSITKNCCVNCF